MAFLLNILLALATLFAADVGVEPLVRAPLAAAGLVVVPYGLAAAARALAVRGRFRAAAAFAGALVGSAPVLQLVAVVALGWADAVGDALGRPVGVLGWPGPELALALLPYVVLELCAIDARARLSEGGGVRARRLRSFQARMFAAALLPVAGYLAVSSAVAASETARVHVEEVALLNALVALVLFLALALLLPAILRATWDTAPVEAGWARSVLEEVARHARFHCREILVWRTGGLVANAAVVGFHPRHRLVLLSDALLAQLGPRELAAVFAHEIAHAKKHHALVFGAFAVGFFLWADLALAVLDLERDGAEAALFAGALVLWWLVFGWLSRRFELEADFASVETTGDPDALASALEAVGGVHGRRRTGWRHFSTADRVARIHAFAADPRTARGLRRLLAASAAAGAVLALSALALQGVRLVRALPNDLAVADLRLGRYESVARRADAGGLDPKVAELARLAADLPPGAAPDALAGRAREALARGQLAEATDWLELALLRGQGDLEPVADALVLAAVGEDEEALDLLRRRAPEWEEALREALGVSRDQ